MSRIAEVSSPETSPFIRSIRSMAPGFVCSPEVARAPTPEARNPPAPGREGSRHPRQGQVHSARRA
jgi:hypothetical protein